jgi:hypothetical protein
MANLLANITSTAAATAPASWVDMPAMSGNFTVAGTYSVVLMLFHVSVAAASDDTADFRFAIDHTREGPQLTSWTDSVTGPETQGTMMAYAKTGLSAGNHDFSVQWQDLISGTTADTSRERSFQIIEFDSDASLLLNTSAIDLHQSIDTWEIVPGMSGLATVAADSLLLFIAGFPPDMTKSGDRSADLMFSIDRSRVGPVMGPFKDHINETSSLGAIWAASGVAAGDKVLALEWLERTPWIESSDERLRTFQVIQVTATFDLLTDVNSVSSQSAPATFADMTDMTGTETIDSDDSVAFMTFNYVPLDNAGASAQLRFADGGTTEGPQLVNYCSAANDVFGLGMSWAKTSVGGSKTFSMQWDELVSTMATDTSRNRSFQIMDFKSAAAPEPPAAEKQNTLFLFT